MKVLTKSMRALLYTGLILWTLIQSYAIGLMAGGAFIVPVFAVWSAVNKLPPVVTDRWWLIYLLTGIPVGIYSFIYLIKHVFFSHSKQDKKQDNGNQ